jgi:hypothetical protein
MRLRPIISSAVSAGIGVVAANICYANKAENDTKKLEKDIEKMNMFYHILVEWLTLKQEGKSLEEYFIDNGYRTVAIYGMKELGERLYDELNGSSVEVKYVVDQDAENIYCEKMVCSPYDKLQSVDVMVVSAVYHMDRIKNELQEKVPFPIISLEDVVYGLK